MITANASASSSDNFVPPPYPPLAGTNIQSFAYVTLKDRLPVILTTLIDTLCRFEHDTYSASAKSPEERSEQEEERRQRIHQQARKVISHLSGLRYELQCNKQLRPLEVAVPCRTSSSPSSSSPPSSSSSSPSSDTAQVSPREWNGCAEWEDLLGIICRKSESEPDVPDDSIKLLKPGSWFSVPWLISECYLYRRILECFLLVDREFGQLSPDVTWSWYRDFDYFGEQKRASLGLCKKDVCDVSKRLQHVLDTKSLPDEETFLEFLQCSLWGNQVDLSMHAGKTVKEVEEMQHQDRKHVSQEYVLVNDGPRLWKYLQRQVEESTAQRTIHVILDNAGAELFMDLCLADWLLSMGFATTIRFHMKVFPWFVSDVLQSDVDWLLKEALPDLSKAANAPWLQQTVERWTSHRDQGKWTFQSHLFWNSGYSFWNLPGVAKDLFAELKQSVLCIFKGDLNYRKLVYDCTYPYPHTTPFMTAVGPMASLPLVALRTCKADVVAGLPEGTAERLDAKVGINQQAKGWLVTGRYAVVQSTVMQG